MLGNMLELCGHALPGKCSSKTYITALQTVRVGINIALFQVCSILWSANYKELISGHGFAQNQLVVWKYPTMTRVTELKGKCHSLAESAYAFT